MNLPDNYFSLSGSKLKKILFFLSCLFLMPLIALAKASTVNQPLHIEADSVEIREKQGVSVYKGHVVISRGDMEIKGELIHITTRKNNAYIIDINGKPARFKQLNDKNQNVVAQSEKMSFSSETGILTMDKKAILIQDQNKFTSEHIIYNTRQDIVQAGKGDTTSDTAKSERVTITIQPKAEAELEKGTATDQTK